MAVPILQRGASLGCPHGAPVELSGGTTRVTLSGLPAITIDDGFAVAGCPFCVTVDNQIQPQPCVRIARFAGGLRVTIEGRPVALADGSGVGVTAENVAQGAVVIALTQSRVVAR